MLSWQLRDINDFLLLYRLHKTIWIFHAARGNQPAWWLYSASHPSGTQLWTTTVLLIRMVLCPGWDLWKLFSSTSFPALFHTPSRITLNTTNVSLVYHEMRKLSSSTQGESLLLLQKVSTEEQNSVTNKYNTFSLLNQYQCKLYQQLLMQRKQNCTVSQTKAVWCLWGKRPPLHLVFHTADATSFSCLFIFALLFTSALSVTAGLSQFILPEEVGQNCISTWD